MAPQKDRTERQKHLLSELTSANRALSGSELAERCNVTRQVVVHDIALLRAAGEPILSTPRGYVLQAENPIQARKQHVLSVSHPPQLVGKELQILVDFGFHIKDVLIEHPQYGELRGSLLLSSRKDIEYYLQQVQTSGGTFLSALTDGYHMHTIEADSLDHLPEAIEELRKNGIIVYE